MRKTKIHRVVTCAPEVIKCVLVAEDVNLYDFPPDFTKKADTRRAGSVAKYGDVSVELDALPIDLLQTRLRNEAEARMDLEALQRVQRRSGPSVENFASCWREARSPDEANFS